MSRLRRTFLRASLFALVLAGAAGPAVAQAPVPPGTFVEPYFMLPNMSGRTGVGPFVGDVDAGTGDIMGALDFGAMLYIERHGTQWSYGLDTIFMNLGAEQTTQVGTLDVDLRQLGVTAQAFRRLSPWAEAMLAVTYNELEVGLTGSGPLGVDREGDESWVDPYVGVRLMTPDTAPWRFGVLGAIGGFGVGSDFAWQFYPQVGYRVSPLFEVTGAFRALDMDFEDGSGNETFVYDMTTFGAQIGGRFHF